MAGVKEPMRSSFVLFGVVLCKLGMLRCLEWMMLSVCHPRETRDCFSLSAALFSVRPALFSSLLKPLGRMSAQISAESKQQQPQQQRRKQT